MPHPLTQRGQDFWKPLLPLFRLSGSSDAVWGKGKRQVWAGELGAGRGRGGREEAGPLVGNEPGLE